MYENMEVKDLFPTPLWIIDLQPDVAARLNESLLVEIHALTADRPQIPIGSTWQTDPTLQNLAQFDEFTAIVRSAVRGALNFLDIQYDTFEITGCWANINPTGSINTSHNHPNNYLSGVYYVATPGDSGRIEFTDPRPGNEVIFPRVKNWNVYNGNKVTLDVSEGRLIIFPAWLNHSVPVNRSNAERVSISFNVMFSSFTETMSRPLWKGSAPLKGN